MHLESITLSLPHFHSKAMEWSASRAGLTGRYDPTASDRVRTERGSHGSSSPDSVSRIPDDAMVQAIWERTMPGTNTIKKSTPAPAYTGIDLDRRSGTCPER